MIQYTNTLAIAEGKKHSVVFKPKGEEENQIVSSIYVMNGVIPAGEHECKITISWPEGDDDADYNAL